MMEIVISQQDNQNITIENDNIQNISITQNENQNIEIQNNNPQDIDLHQAENQVILIDGSGAIYGINDVLVNGVSVVSNGIAYVLVPTKTSELENNSGFITSETDPTVPSYVKTISLADINNWNSKQNALISGSTIKTINNESLLGSGNLNIEGTVYSAGTGININASNEISNTIVSYNDLEDLPEIPTKTSDLTNDSDFVTSDELSDVAFSGSYADLSNTPEIPQFTSDLTNDSGFIDKNVNDLTYYTKTSDLSSVALSGDYDDLLNKPTIPTKTSDLNNDSGFIDKNVNDLTNYTLSSNLSAVATSGSYNDLSNTPTIPTVNDGTLTIQKNGSTIDSFSANSSSNKTVNITVPTQTSELTNNSGFIDNTVNNLTNYYTQNEIDTKLNYSTSEKIVGKWINGENLYAITVETTQGNLVNDLNTITSKRVIKFEGYIQTTATGVRMPLNNSFSQTTFTWTLWTDGNGVVAGQFGSQFNSSSPCVVTMYYIKVS